MVDLVQDFHQHPFPLHHCHLHYHCLSPGHLSLMVVQNHFHLGLIVKTDCALERLLNDLDAHFSFISDVNLVK